MDVSFLAADLKKVDPDRYLLSLFAPARAREALWALFLFNHEIARTRSMVSETQLGLIRLQWWRDEIDRLYAGGDGGQIPILSTLAPVIHAQNLPQEWFEAMIYAREFDLEDVAPASWDGLKKYADFTTTPLNKLALKIAGETASDDEIGGISTNFALMETIRSVPLMLTQRRCMLPQDWLEEKGLSPQKIIDFNHKTEISQLVQRAVSLIAPYRKPVSTLLHVQQRMSFIYLDKIKKLNFDVFSSKMHAPPHFFVLRLWLSVLVSRS